MDIWRPEAQWAQAPVGEVVYDLRDLLEGPDLEPVDTSDELVIVPITFLPLTQAQQRAVAFMDRLDWDGLPVYPRRAFYERVLRGCR